jgi:membrane-bound serine protease (ClpP class)
MKKSILSLFIILSFFVLLSLQAFAQASTDSPSSAKNLKKLYVIPVSGTIDLGLSAYIKRAAADAKKQDADAVIFDINTYGGRVDAADEMVATIADLSPIPTFAYISHSAWSAGALIALACKDITMQAGSSIGSAEPRIMGMQSSDQTTDEKIVSALRGGFKATAEANGHSPNLAQAMVDVNIELIQVEFDGQVLLLTRAELDDLKAKNPKKNIANEKIICPKDKLLNLTANEAFDLNLSSKTLKSKQELYDHIKEKLSYPKDTELEILTTAPTWSENLVRFLTHPIISPLLLSLGFLGILFELKMPGWGVSGTLGVIFILLFFWGHYLVGLADFADIGIFIIGITFLVIELFYIPGFGALGVLGIIFMIAGLILMLVKQPLKFPSFEFTAAFYTLTKAMVITTLLGILGVKYLPKTTFFKNLLLETEEKKDLGFQTKSLSEKITVGKIGIAKSILRPSGRAMFEGQIIDVTTQGEFIEKKAQVVVARIEGNKVFVEQKKEDKNADMA